MKVLKRANQKNVELDCEMYDFDSILRMLERKTIVYFKDYKDANGRFDHMEATNKFDDYDDYKNAIETHSLRVYLNDKKEIKVICEDGYYQTIVIDTNDEKLYVKI